MLSSFFEVRWTLASCVVGPPAGRLPSLSCVHVAGHLSFRSVFSWAHASREPGGVRTGSRSSCHPVPASPTLLCLWPRRPLWTVMPESSLRWEAPLSELPSSAPGLHVNLTTNFGHGLKSRLYTVPHFLRKAGRRETTGHSVPLGKMNCLAPCVRIFESWP